MSHHWTSATKAIFFFLLIGMAAWTASAGSSQQNASTGPQTHIAPPVTRQDDALAFLSDLLSHRTALPPVDDTKSIVVSGVSETSGVSLAFRAWITPHEYRFESKHVGQSSEIEISNGGRGLRRINTKAYSTALSPYAVIQRVLLPDVFLTSCLIEATCTVMKLPDKILNSHVSHTFLTRRETSTLERKRTTILWYTDPKTAQILAADIFLPNGDVASGMRRVRAQFKYESNESTSIPIQVAIVGLSQQSLTTFDIKSITTVARGNAFTSIEEAQP